MELSQATSYFNRARLQGYNGISWEDLNVYVNLQSFDRFLGPRTFGQKQRILVVGPGNLIPDSYEFVRLEPLTPYLIISFNDDVGKDGLYGRYYVVQETRKVVELVELTKTTAPSGLAGTATPTVIASTFCDYERYTTEAATGLDNINYVIYTFLLPLSLQVTVDHLLRVDGEDFDVKEVNPLLNVREVRATKRGATP